MLAVRWWGEHELRRMMQLSKFTILEQVAPVRHVGCGSVGIDEGGASAFISQ